MSSVNKVILIGNLGRDPELKFNPSGVAFCTISLATTRAWKSRETGERQEETEWHKVVFNDKLAEIVGEYCKKGKPIYVEGRLRTRKWTDKEGKDVYTTEVIASEMQLLGGRDGREDAPAPAPAPRAPAPSTRGNRAPAAPNRTGFDDMDDDIPFILSLSDFSIEDGKTRRMNRTRF